MTETHSEFYERWSARVRPYARWQFEQFAPFVGKVVADVGCGLGAFAEHFLAHGVERYIGVEPDPDLRRRFEARHRDPRAVLARVGDATDPALAAELRAAGCDTAFSSNVLEHIERDDLALRNMIESVRPGGHIALLVPAHPFLYGSLDRFDNHYRRYTKASMRELIAKAGGGAELVSLYYFNAAAALGWLIKGRVLRETRHEDENYAAMNLVLPVVRRLEALVRPPFGLSLIAVLRRRI